MSGKFVYLILFLTLLKINYAAVKASDSLHSLYNSNTSFKTLVAERGLSTSTMAANKAERKRLALEVDAESKTLETLLLTFEPAPSDVMAQVEKIAKLVSKHSSVCLDAIAKLSVWKEVEKIAQVQVDQDTMGKHLDSVNTRAREWLSNYGFHQDAVRSNRLNNTFPVDKAAGKGDPTATEVKVPEVKDAAPVVSDGGAPGDGGEPRVRLLDKLLDDESLPSVSFKSNSAERGASGSSAGVDEIVDKVATIILQRLGLSSEANKVAEAIQTDAKKTLRFNPDTCSTPNPERKVTGHVDRIDKLDKSEYDHKHLSISDTLHGLGTRASAFDLYDRPSVASNQRNTSFKSNEYMQRVPMPNFDGTNDFETWYSMFLALIDSSGEPDIVKFLRMKDSLKGEPLELVESLPHDAISYQIAKCRLNDFYGGVLRQLQRRYNDIQKFKRLEVGDIPGFKRLLSLADQTVRCLINADRLAELGPSALSHSFVGRMPVEQVVQYNEWRARRDKLDNLRSLILYLEEYISRQVTAQELVYGVRSKNKTRAVNSVAPTGGNGTGHQNGARKGNSGGGVTKSGGGTNNGFGKSSNVKCLHCRGGHYLWGCPMFAELALKVRVDKVKELGACFRCLSPKHVIRDCPSSRYCGVGGCNGKHHRLLHDPDRPRPRPADEVGGGVGVKPSPTPANLVATGTRLDMDREARMEGAGTLEKEKDVHSMMVSQGQYKNRKIALRMIPVVVVNGNKRLVVNALLDEGSCCTYLNAKVSRELGLSGSPWSTQVQVFEGRTIDQDSEVVQLTVESLDGLHRMSDAAEITKNITGTLEVVNWNLLKQKWAHLRDIPFHNYTDQKHIDLLLGANFLHMISSLQDVEGNAGEPAARLTRLGWTCMGICDEGSEVPSTHFSFVCMSRSVKIEPLDRQVQKFWEWEAIGETKPQLTPLEKKAELSFQKSIRKVGNRYEVEIPWVEEAPYLPESYSSAYRRLCQTEARLLKSPDVAKSYRAEFVYYITHGFFKEIQPDEIPQFFHWFLSHFPVIREDKTTTKVRPVYDAGAEVEGVSLNSHELVGPKLQQDLVSVLLRFRHYRIGMGSDIAKMYLQILVALRDQYYQLVLWRDLKTDEPPKIYRATRVMFGRKSSPYLAQKVVQYNAEQYSESHPHAAQCLKRSTYMDDSLDSKRTEAEGVLLYQQMKYVGAQAGMDPTKWLSNSKEVLSQIPAEDRAVNLDLFKSEHPCGKMLGMMWDALIDSFMYVLQKRMKPIESKRILLKVVASIFDPLGLILPFTIRGRALLQELWFAGCEWDGPIPKGIQDKIAEWVDEFVVLANIRVPRALVHLPDDVGERLVVLGDASDISYGAVAYLVVTYNNGNMFSRLVGAKAKVAPLHSVSIPRLELEAATVALKIGLKFAADLDLDATQNSYYSDSMDVLFWVHSHSRLYRPYVGNRIGRIHEGSEPSQWKYVNTSMNTADFLTRGLSSRELADPEQSWWTGPAFLVQPMEQHPAQPESLNSTRSVEDEMRSKSFKFSMLVFAHFPLKQQVERLNPEKFSSWDKLVGVTGWVKRFLNNMKGREVKVVDKTLSVDERRRAEVSIIKAAQSFEWDKEIKALVDKKVCPTTSKIASLNPWLDDDGILRSRTRLQKSHVINWCTRNPILLPRYSPVTDLIIKKEHESHLHCQVGQTLAGVRARFLILADREVVRKVVKSCTLCKKLEAKFGAQIMAELPVDRVVPTTRPFEKAAVDFAGPFLTKIGRGRPRAKHWLALFTCFTTRAVHLELAYGLDVDSFLRVLTRFASRRCVPSKLYSDNGTNFVATEKSLRDMIKALAGSDVLAQKLAIQNIQWIFQPARSPHFGGLHESMIKSAKKVLRRVLGNAEVTDEELETAFCRVESCLNARPLTYGPSSVMHDEPVLTPGHFCYGNASTDCVPSGAKMTGDDLRRRWRVVQELMEVFWERWVMEWLPTLGPRRKWLKEFENVQIGEVVLVPDLSEEPGHWPLGRITAVIPGSDGRVRVVKVRVKGKDFTRAIVKICPLKL